MRWQGRRESTNVEDRRRGGQQMAVGGGIMTLVVLLAAIFFPDLVPILKLFDNPQGAPQGAPAEPVDDAIGGFIRTVVADNEDIWGRLFPKAFGKRFVPARLVMFTGRVQSGCGFASAGMGPFYCPLDETVYIDPTFYEELRRRFGASGEFAHAYVIAHEFGHHIQNQLGISQKVQALQRRLSPEEYNRVSVRLELQADFLAGVWAYHMARYEGVLDERDIRDAMNAASAIGDDRIQKQTQGYVQPENFTHGTSEQRVRWFMKGFKSGDPTRMDEAFEAAEL
jgi:predicted metalloprotease